MSTAEESAVSPEVAIEYVVATGTPSALPVCMSTIVYEGLRVKRSPSTHMTTLSIARRSVEASSVSTINVMPMRDLRVSRAALGKFAPIVASHKLGNICR